MDAYAGAVETVVRAAPVLTPQEWRARQGAHVARVTPWVEPHLARRRAGRAHPVEDFLFTYYRHRPAALLRWHPGRGTGLVDAPEHASSKGYRTVDGVSAVDDDHVAARRGLVGGIRSLLVATASRPPGFGCFGMHEWAMVYRQAADETRHPLPLRLGAEGTAALVDDVKVRCSHFDAYRFFTPAARPLNELRPTRATQADHEQPGCLHANMDVYRWAYKLSPLVDSDLVADCFELARAIRSLDMRASPYDVSSLGLQPLAMETAAGRADYARGQREFAADAAVLRGRLIDRCATTLPADPHATTDPDHPAELAPTA